MKHMKTTSTAMVTLGQLAEELAAAPASVRRWLKSGGVPAYSFGRGTVRYRRCDVDAWLAEAEEDLDDEEDADGGHDDDAEVDDDLDDDLEGDDEEDGAEDDGDEEDDLDDDCDEDEDG